MGSRCCESNLSALGSLAGRVLMETEIMTKTCTILSAILIGCFAIGSAFATDSEPHKINFLAPLADLDGRPLQYCVRNEEPDPTKPPAPPKCAEFKDWTLSDLAVAALAVQERDESGIEQVRRMVLGQEIYKKGEAALDSKDTDLLCEAIAKFVNKTGTSALLTLRAWQILDPARVKK